MNASLLRYVLTTGPRRVDLVGPGPDGLDDLLLEGLVGEDLEPLLERVLVAHEGLVLFDDGPHLGVDALQVVVA